MDARNQVVMSQVMLPHQANVAGNVHGGEIMKFMDMAAGACAMKYARSNCVTARVDELVFHIPIFVGALVTCTANIAYVGNTSMDGMWKFTLRIWSQETARRRLCAPILPWFP